MTIDYEKCLRAYMQAVLDHEGETYAYVPDLIARGLTQQEAVEVGRAAREEEAKHTAEAERTSLGTDKGARSMKISELIAVLQAKMEQYGDREVEITWEGGIYGGEFAPSHVYLSKAGTLYLDADHNHYKRAFSAE